MTILFYCLGVAAVVSAIMVVTRSNAETVEENGHLLTESLLRIDLDFSPLVQLLATRDQLLAVVAGHLEVVTHVDGRERLSWTSSIWCCRGPGVRSSPV